MTGRLFNSFLLKFAGAVSGFLSVIFLSRFLGPELKGKASLLLTDLALCVMVSGFIGGGAIVYFVSRVPVKKLATWSYAWAIISSLLVFIFYLIRNGGCASMNGPEVLLLFFLAGVFSVNSFLVLGAGKVVAFNFLNAGIPIFSLISFLVFHELDVFPAGDLYLFSVLFSYLICWLLSFIWLKDLPSGKGSPFSPREIIVSGINNQLAQLFFILSFRFAYYSFDITGNAFLLGVFSNAVSLIEGSWLIPQTLAGFLYATLSSGPQDETSKRETSLLYIRVALVGAFFSSIFLCLIPEVFWVNLFGNQFQGIRPFILSLAIPSFFYQISIILTHYFSGVSQFSVNAGANFTALIAVVIAGGLLWPPENGWAVAVTSIAYISVMLFQTILFVRKNHVRPADIVPSWKDLVRIRSIH